MGEAVVKVDGSAASPLQIDPEENEGGKLMRRRGAVRRGWRMGGGRGYLDPPPLL
jgi:hypothetical protein